MTLNQRRKTFGEIRWPETPEFVSIAEGWNSDAITILLKFVWKGYKLLVKDVFNDIDITKAEDEIERSITQYLAPKIRKIMSGDEPFDIEQGIYEYETRSIAPAQSPQYDLAFVLKNNLRVMWPLEAKTLKTDGAVADYINEIKNNYLTCRYAPFSEEAAMLGYLLTGNSTKVLKNISIKMPCKLTSHPEFKIKDHKISSHKRNVPKGKDYPSNFSCHHLIMSFSNS